MSDIPTNPSEPVQSEPEVAAPAAPIATPTPVKPVVPAPAKPAVTAALPVKPFIFNKAALEAHLKKIKDHYLTFAGKATYNPHFFLTATVAPLEKRLSDGETSAELSAAIVALKEDCKPIEQLVKNAKAADEQAKLKIPPPGLPPRGM